MLALAPVLEPQNPLHAALCKAAEEALRAAAANGHKDTVELLLGMVPFTQSGRLSAVRVAAANGRKDTLLLLLDREVTTRYGAGDRYAVYAAAKFGQTSTVQLLLKTRACLDTSAHGGALLIATQAGHTSVVALLLDLGADVQAQRDTALIIASQHGHTDIARLLLASGADPSALPAKSRAWASCRMC
eukprot:jgi/Chrzof1/8057/UNPLg00102.t1